MPYGVSNSFKRGTLRTYARQPKLRRADEDEGAQRKRVRMDDKGIISEESITSGERTHPALISSPPTSPLLQNAVFSDPPHKASKSPPSSPPPRLASPPAKPSAPAFNVLKRKHSGHSRDALVSEPLTEISLSSTNARTTQRTGKKVRLVQMQIDLGGEIRRTCKECRMEYIPSNAEDATLHKDFHSLNAGGVDMGRGFAMDRALHVWSTLGEGEQVVVVDKRSPLYIRNKVKRVLTFVNRELGAVDVEDKLLWGEFRTKEERKKRGRPPKVLKSVIFDVRFKVFLYLSGDKCIGLCLGERISAASKVVSSVETKALGQEDVIDLKSSSILIETSCSPAQLGISRIWTSKSHQRKGIASELLNNASNGFFPGMTVPKELIAFSQPTESGGQLAEAWFGKKTGWMVYAET